MTAGSSQHRMAHLRCDHQTRLGEKTLVSKTVLANFLLCQESSPKISPRPSPEPQIDQPLFIWPWLFNPKSSCAQTGDSGVTCADDDLLNLSSLAYLAWNWPCEEILATAEVRHSWKKYCISSSVVPLRIQFFFESIFLHQCSAGFLQQVWGCIFTVWCVTLFNFVCFFSEWVVMIAGFLGSH